MNEEKLAKIYDSLSDQDKKIVGMIGVSFIQSLHERIYDVILRYSNEKNN